VGAIALVIVVVAVVPLVLDRAPKPTHERIEVQMPSAATHVPAPPPQQRIDDPTAAAATGATQAPIDAVADTSPPPPAQQGNAPQSPAELASESAVKPPVDKPVAVVGEGYVVQIIATASREKGRDFKRRLAKLKFPVYVERTPDGEKTRVRVGPYGKREAAEQARQRLIKLGFYPGRVVRKGE